MYIAVYYELFQKLYVLDESYALCFLITPRIEKTEELL